MQFDSLAALWNMNGHGPFVWSAYAIAAATLIALVVVPLRRQRRFYRERLQAERSKAAQRASTLEAKKA